MIFLLLNLEQFIIQVLNAVELLDFNFRKKYYIPEMRMMGRSVSFKTKDPQGTIISIFEPTTIFW